MWKGQNQIVIKCNLALFTDQRLLYALYDKLSSKMANMRSLFGLLLCFLDGGRQRTVFCVSVLMIPICGLSDLLVVIFQVSSNDDIFVSNDCLSYPLCLPFSGRDHIYLAGIILCHQTMPVKFIQEIAATKNLLFTKALNLHKSECTLT